MIRPRLFLQNSLRYIKHQHLDEVSIINKPPSQPVNLQLTASFISGLFKDDVNIPEMKWQEVGKKLHNAELHNMYSLPNMSGVSVNRSQMDIKREIYDIRIWKKKHLFLDISSTNIDTLVPSLYQCVETRSIKVFDCCLSHFRNSVSTSSSSTKGLPRFSTQLWTSLRDKHFPP
jgi:hypothetical protein